MATEPSRLHGLRIGDDADLATLRRHVHAANLGVDWSRLDDHAVAHFVAWAAPMAAGPGPTLRNLAPQMTVAAAAPPPAASSSRPSQAAASPPAASQATLAPDVDAAATAQNLRDAANDGVPFCEECARAAAA